MFSKFKPKSEFAKNTLTLMTGTSVAQAIPIAISPVLTRLYSPEDFGVLALYLSLVSIFSILATGRYEMAIMLPEKDEDVNSLVALIYKIMLVVCVTAMLVIVFFNEQITDLLGNQEVSNWLYFVPISVCLLSSYQVFNYLLIREKNFKRLAKNKVIVSTSNGLTQLSLGVVIAKSFGLLIGNIFGYIAAIAAILWSKITSKYFGNTTPESIKKVAKEYRKFPQYDVPAILVNVMAGQLPLLTLGKYFSLGVLGCYSLMYKVLMMPINLLSNSVLDVFKQKATEDYNELGNCNKIYVQTLKKLVLIGVVPFSVLAIFAPVLFKFVFGDEWEIAGVFAQIMTPMFFFNFIVNPLSYTLFIVQKQNINLIGQLILLVLTIISIVLGVYFNNKYLIVVFFSASYSLVYMLYLVVSYKFSKGKNES